MNLHDVPGYWQHETSGALREPIRKYLAGETLTLRDIALLRAYFKQWVDAPVWNENPHGGSNELESLRQAANEIRTKDDINAWWERAVAFGMDPL